MSAAIACGHPNSLHIRSHGSKSGQVVPGLDCSVPRRVDADAPRDLPDREASTFASRKLGVEDVHDSLGGSIGISGDRAGLPTGDQGSLHVLGRRVRMVHEVQSAGARGDRRREARARTHRVETARERGGDAHAWSRDVDVGPEVREEGECVVSDRRFGVQVSGAGPRIADRLEFVVPLLLIIKGFSFPRKSPCQVATVCRVL